MEFPSLPVPSVVGDLHMKADEVISEAEQLRDVSGGSGISETAIGL